MPRVYKHKFQDTWEQFPAYESTLIGRSRAAYFDSHPDEAPYVCSLYWCEQRHIGPADCEGTPAKPHSCYPMKRAE